MRVLGLDPSLRNYGWVILNTEEFGEARCEAKGRLHSTTDTTFVDRYVGMRERLKGLVQKYEPDFVGIEYPIFGASYSEGMYALFVYSCEALKSVGQNTVFFANTQTKAYVRRLLKRPKGWKMDKADMILAARRETTIGRWAGDEADAYWVAHLTSRFWLFQQGDLLKSDLTPLERKQFCGKQHKRDGSVREKGIIFRKEERFYIWSDIEMPGDIDGER